MFTFLVDLRKVNINFLQEFMFLLKNDTNTLTGLNRLKP